jgi:hypothetical protein
MAVYLSPMVVRLFLNDPKDGKSERWPIYATSWAEGLRVGQLLAQARANVMASNVVLEWASLGTITPPYIEQPLITTPLQPLPQWGPLNDPSLGLLFSFADEDGVASPRLFTKIDPSEVYNKHWIRRDLSIPNAIPPLPANPALASKDLLWQNMLATFRTYTGCCLQETEHSFWDGPGFWVNPWSLVQYAAVSRFYPGRPWVRMSWETSNYAYSTGWSPCGCAVTVLRFSYAIPCRFGVGWRPRYIHYYPCKPGATVLPFATPFYGWARSKENDDFTGVGETRKEKKKDWTTGIEYGNPPGTTWDGTEAEFGGMAPVPTWGDGPTPLPLRASCDTPNFGRPIMPGGLCLGGPGTNPLP